MSQTSDLLALKQLARDLRLDVLDMTTPVGSGHVSSSYSSVEILTALYFGGILRYRADEPHWPERDRFFISKGHAAPIFYAVLARAGYFDRDELWGLRTVNRRAEGHPVQDKLPGIETTTGSLGKGLSVALGHVLAGRLNKLDYRCYVLLGDGECQEGQIWEAAMAAAHFQADNLIAIVDYNKYQESGPISREMELEPFVDKWRAFGWHVEEIDGHDFAAIIATLRAVQEVKGQPSVIIAHTVKGRPVSFVEADYRFHGKALKPDQAEKAREEILCA
ncbi:MAG: transketolase [Chloroflexi bacterium]|nr:transketolase [Chloroflexota bacterium]